MIVFRITYLDHEVIISGSSPYERDENAGSSWGFLFTVGQSRSFCGCAAAELLGSCLRRRGKLAHRRSTKGGCKLQDSRRYATAVCRQPVA